MFRIINSKSEINYINLILRGEKLSADSLAKLHIKHVYKESLLCSLLLNSDFSNKKNIDRINRLSPFNVTRVVNSLCYYTNNSSLISECQEVKALKDNYSVLLHVIRSDQFSITFRRMYSFSDEFLDSKRVIFLHIPKTAGTSIEGLFKSNYEDESYIERNGIIDVNTYKKAKVIGGHIPLSCYNYSRKHIYLTVLRNPIDRCLSLINYYNSNRDGQLKFRISRGYNPKDPFDSIKNSDFKNMFKNEMCYYLSSDGSRSFNSAVTNIKWRNFIIGHSDFLDEFTVALKDVFNLQSGDVNEKNKAPNLNYLKEYYKNRELIDLIEQNNKEDIKLEAFCKQHRVLCNVEKHYTVTTN